MFKKTKRINLAIFDTYKIAHGHMNIPTTFVIPNDPKIWPVESHRDFKLGNYVSRIRKSLNKNDGVYNASDLEKLLANGFVPNAHLERSRIALLAFQTHKDIFGHVNIPDDFIVPSANDLWPKETHGINLGSLLDNIRNHDIHETIHDNLIELGVDLGQQSASPDFERVFKALSDYKAVHGDVIVPQKFSVPRDAAYSVNAWGLKLGTNLQFIRSKGYYFEHRDRLEALGVNFDVKNYDVRGFDVIYSALEAYKAVHGNLLVHQKFVVPQDDVNYPPETWGMKLGFNVTNIRNKGYYFEHRGKLKELGFVFKNVNSVQEIN
jgi:hypothetical protein